jgi:hypothetical protein
MIATRLRSNQIAKIAALEGLSSMVVKAEASVTRELYRRAQWPKSQL